MLTMKKKKRNCEIRDAGSSKTTVLELDPQQENPVAQESCYHTFGHVSIQLERLSHTGLFSEGRVQGSLESCRGV